MSRTDWRQYRQGTGSKGFKGLKPEGEEDQNLKPLKPTIKPNQANAIFYNDSSLLGELGPLKPLKPGVEDGKVSPPERPEPSRATVERWVEKAAIMEFDGGIPREQAEERAAMEYGMADRLDDLRKHWAAMVAEKPGNRRNSCAERGKGKGR